MNPVYRLLRAAEVSFKVLRTHSESFDAGPTLELLKEENSPNRRHVFGVFAEDPTSTVVDSNNRYMIVAEGYFSRGADLHNGLANAITNTSCIREVHIHESVDPAQLQIALEQAKAWMKQHCSRNLPSAVSKREVNITTEELTQARLTVSRARVGHKRLQSA